MKDSAEKVIGWHWHRWTGWSGVAHQLHYSWQQRTCVVCGKLRVRIL